MAFSDKFVWGAAAASYQIEGAADEDGRGLSVWDVFSRTPEKVWNGDTGDVACDHYHRYPEDVAMMKEIGLHAYRLSVSWPRVLPTGVGQVNEKGLDFYDRVVDELLAKDITPYVTLFHWDLPFELYCRGSWMNRDSINWFADYTEIVVRALGDRVKNWMTFNEPSVFTVLGYELGIHAPGDKLTKTHTMRILHHVNVAHGMSVQVIRANSGADTQVGIAPTTSPTIPLIEDEAHINAARHGFNGIWEEAGLWNITLWLDPMLKGEYPEKALELWGEHLPLVDGDMQTMNQPLDFLGINIYQGMPIALKADGQPDMSEFKTGFPRTMMDWPVTPGALYWGPKFLYERYGLPIYITENGLASMDWIALDGKVHDTGRIDFLKRYLREYKRAAADGVELAGYFQWSIMDNFEWAEGYKRRFGIVYVDYETQKRTLKDSAYWYRDVINSNGAALDE
jgi:beta-glucosidase